MTSRFSLLFPSLLLLACSACQSCPDLDQPGLQLRVYNASDEVVSDEAIRIDADLVDDSGNIRSTVLTDWAPASGLPRIPAGRYRMVARADGAEFGQLEEVCTTGSLTGCDAEEAPADSTPIIAVRKDAAGARTLELERNGKCP